MLKKLTWIELAIQVSNYHQSRLREDPEHTISKTAKELNRSYGSVAEYLKLASWLKTHQVQLEKFKSAYEALIYVRNRESQIKRGEA